MNGVWPGEAAEYLHLRSTYNFPVRFDNIGREYVIVASAIEPCSSCAFSSTHQSEYCWNVDCENIPWCLYETCGRKFEEVHTEVALTNTIF